MDESRTQRRLAAILAADVAGYSRMMAADELGTLASLRETWASRFNPVVARFQGRIVKMMGDGAMVEFASAVDAVECAVAIQNAMVAHNGVQGRPDPIELRIGINLGDIVIEGDDIFGDGVNVAARLEAQAPRNGLLVSEIVYSQIKGKVSVAFADAGELALKNLPALIRAWHWVAEAEARAPDAVPHRPDDGPSIAVLPFTNMSDDPAQEYFSDGISEDIITDLSKIIGLMVIARNSSFAYKGKTPDIRAVGRELGVKSVLEGSIRRAGNRVRITAQLIDAATGGHLWAERYDRDLTDIFAVQDEVTLQIVGALRVTLRPAEQNLLAERRSGNIEAHDHYLRGRQLQLELYSVAKDHRLVVEQAVAAFKRAIELDPTHARAYAGLSVTHNLDYQNHWTDTPDLLALSISCAAKAVEIDPDEPLAHYAVSVIATFDGHPEIMKSASERALSLNPNFALAYGARGNAEIFLGNPLGGIPYFERAMRLDPVYGRQVLHFMGIANLVAGRFEPAAAYFRQRITLVPATDLSRSLFAAVLGHLGQIAEARRVWQEMMAINPKYSLDTHLGRLPWRNPAHPEVIRAGLAKAGLPE